MNHTHSSDSAVLRHVHLGDKYGDPATSLADSGKLALAQVPDGECRRNLGKGGHIPANRRDEQELSVLCLWVLQAAVVWPWCAPPGRSPSMAAEYGIDLDDLDPQHSLTTDPTVLRRRQAAKLLGEGIWIAVKLPGEGKGDDDLPDGVVARRWTTVALYPDELGWLR
jgi:hypothetical protein